MKRIYSTWGFEKDERPHTLIGGTQPLTFENGEVDSDCEKIFYQFEACSWEEANAIYHLRQEFEPYNPDVPAAPCPKCGVLFYPEGGGECWNCDHQQ